MKNHGSVRSYTIGFLISIILTLFAYLGVIIHENSGHKVLSHEFLIPFILILAVSQLVVQLFFFLHLGSEKGPRWNTLFFLSTISLVLIVVIGSIWIMANLNYNMTPMQMINYVQSQDGF